MSNLPGSGNFLEDYRDIEGKADRQACGCYIDECFCNKPSEEEEMDKLSDSEVSIFQGFCIVLFYLAILFTFIYVLTVPGLI